ncbi:MAG: amidohydrolase family protein [Gemmatimonadaceae bacterium]|nr:amidohydrolase family protein [Gemmatimonadaceae bacterium]
MTTPHLPRVDAHIHLWDPEVLSYPWLQAHASLARRFLPEDYGSLNGGSARPVDAVVAVEGNVRDGAGVVEAAWLDWVAAMDPRIAGIVAYVDMLDDPRRDHAFTALRRMPRVVGVRHNIQGHPAGFSTQPRFVAGVRAVAAAGYPFDLCATASQLGEVRALVERCPEVHFILDHCGKPDIGHGSFDAWRRDIDAIAAHDTVTCKLSGLFTQCAPDPCDERAIRPYLRHVVEIFGPRRVMYASDWPVCTLAGSADAWHALVCDVVGGLCSRHERDEIFGGTAIRAYRLTITTPA